MEKFKIMMWKMIYPPAWVAVVSALLAYPLVIYILINPGVNSIIAYFSYVLSAYATLVICIGLPKAVKTVHNWIYGDDIRFIVWMRRMLLSHSFTNKYLTDVNYRAKVSLYIGLTVNMGFGIFKGLSGYYYQSAWLWAIGVYYIVLAMVRFMLLRNVKITEKEEYANPKKRKEWKTYRSCGIMMLFLDVAMTGMIIQMVWQDKSNVYSGWTIYLSALYTFYYFITALIGIVKFFHWKNAIVSAAKQVTFAGAAMSVLMLQTTMISTFGEVDHTSRLMNGITGGIVSTFCIGMAIFMIVWSNYQLQKQD